MTKDGVFVFSTWLLTSFLEWGAKANLWQLQHLVYNENEYTMSTVARALLSKLLSSSLMVIAYLNSF